MALKSLFDLCIRYVSMNMNLADSLVGFPEVIGKQIFDACIEYGQMEEDSPVTAHAIRLFGDAYGGLFMDSLQCHNLHMISEFGECMVALAMGVTHLDLSDCLLGNGSEFLRAFMDMCNLKTLNISGNELDEEGFRLMFTRYKVFKTGFESLEVLDISRNNVSVNILKIIVLLPCLKTLKVSIDDEMRNTGKIIVEKWTQTLKNARFEITAGENEGLNTDFNSGWGNVLLNLWSNKMLIWQELKNEKLKRTMHPLQLTNSELQSDKSIEKAKKSETFYSKSLKMAQVSKYKYSQKISRFSTYVYNKKSCESMDNKISVKNTKIENNKRKRDLENNSSKKYPKMAKAFDMELLNMYMKK